MRTIWALLALSLSPTVFANTPAKPNILFILADDMAYRDLEYLPSVRGLIADQGALLAQSFVANSVCCPSRTTTLRGQYSHNTGVMTNQYPSGGFRVFNENGAEKSTIATWLEKAGYRTALMGKYLNGYGGPEGDREYVPPGWTLWAGAVGNAFYRNFNYDLNENGTVRHYGKKEEHHLVDVLQRKALAFVTEPNEKPFFVYLALSTPHTPAVAAPRHAELYANATVPRTEAFDEKDVSDKPAWIRAKKRLSGEQVASLDELERKRRRTLAGIDELVATLVAGLEKAGKLANTYVIFTSDNGFHLGEHRLDHGKMTAYTTDIRVPHAIRGPGVLKGITVQDLVLNTDFAPTVSDLAGISPADFVDGRSIVSLLNGSRNRWRRQSVLIEHLHPGEGKKGIPTYNALRTRDHLYVSFAAGDRELYDLKKDPQELDNLYALSTKATRADLEKKLRALVECAKEGCREAENAGVTVSLVK